MDQGVPFVGICGGVSGGVTLPDTVDMDPDRIYNIGIMGYPIDLDPANPGVPAPPFAPVGGSVLQYNAADGEWNAVVVNLELDLHAPKIIVANALNGDTANDGHFLDPGDGTGIAAALAAVGAGSIPGFPAWSVPQGQVDVWVRAGTYDLLGGLTVPSNVTLRGAGVSATTLSLASPGPTLTLSDNSEVEEFTVTASESPVLAVPGSQASAQHLRLDAGGGAAPILDISGDFGTYHSIKANGAASGIQITGVVGTTISDVAGLLTGSGIALGIDASQGIKVSGVLFSQAAQGFQVRECSTVHLTDFVAGGVTDTGVTIFDSNNVMVSNSRFNGVAGSVTAISLDTVTDVSVTDSQFGEFAAWLLQANGQNGVTITSNRFQTVFGARTLVDVIRSEIAHNQFEETSQK